MLPTVKQIEEVRRAFGGATSCRKTVNALCDAGLERARAAKEPPYWCYYETEAPGVPVQLVLLGSILLLALFL